MIGILTLITAGQDPVMAFTAPAVTPSGIAIAQAKCAAALGDVQYQTQVCPHTPAGFEAFRTWLRPFAPAPVGREAKPCC